MGGTRLGTTLRPAGANTVASPAWARAGHIPAFDAVLNDPRFKTLPHRADIAPVATIGRPLPGYVLRQNAIEGIVGEEAVAVCGHRDQVTSLTRRCLGDFGRRIT